MKWNESTSSVPPSLRSSPRNFLPAPRATGKTNSAGMILNIGDRVSHDTFGLGVVVKVNGEGDRAEATINFGSAGEKRLLLRYAPVEKL